MQAPLRPGRVRTGISRGRRALALTAGAALLVTACGDSQDGAGSPAGADAGSTTGAGDSAVSGEVVIFAAASLQGVFEELGEQLEDEHPELTITFSFGASSTLAQQVISGAPVDVLATASAATMEQADEYVIDPVVFASNVLVIVVPADNPGKVSELADFADPENLIAVCAEEVPCGAAAAAVFEIGGIEPSVDTYGENVTATLNLVASGEVDAGLVYATDAISAGNRVLTIEFNEAEDAINENLIAVLDDSSNPGAAQAWVEFVLSDEGTQLLEQYGFRIPSDS